jgi:hypothetical protein
VYEPVALESLGEPLPHPSHDLGRTQIVVLLVGDALLQQLALSGSKGHRALLLQLCFLFLVIQFSVDSQLLDALLDTGVPRPQGRQLHVPELLGEDGDNPPLELGTLRGSSHGIAEILMRTYYESQGKPTYSIKSSLNI